MVWDEDSQQIGGEGWMGGFAEKMFGFNNPLWILAFGGNLTAFTILSPCQNYNK